MENHTNATQDNEGKNKLDENKTELPRKLNEKESKELREAIKKEDLTKIKDLVNIMEDINQILPIYNQTVLVLSCTLGKIDLVNYLIKLGADVNKTGKYDNDQSALIGGINIGNIEIVKILINAEADINYSDENGESALSKAVIFNNLEIFELLITSGVDIAKCGGNAFTSAALKGKINIIQRFIDLGVDINFRNSDGNTALHYACDHNNLKTVEFLLNNGADENIKNDEGQTVIEVTENIEMKEFIQNYNSSKFVLK